MLFDGCLISEEVLFSNHRMLLWHKKGEKNQNSWRENNREFFLFYFSETFILCFPVYVNKLWPRESVKQKTSSRLQKRRNMSTRILSLACLLASGGRGKRLSYKIQRTGTSETFQLEIVMLPCSVLYKIYFCDSQGRSSATNQALFLPFSPVM